MSPKLSPRPGQGLLPRSGRRVAGRSTACAAVTGRTQRFVLHGSQIAPTRCFLQDCLITVASRAEQRWSEPLLAGLAGLLVVDEVVVGPLGPAARGLVVLAGKSGHGGRDPDVGGVVQAGFAFPVQAPRRDRR